MKKKIKIEKITIVHAIDDNPDTSFLGEYTDDLQEGVIVRQHDEFFEKLPEEDRYPDKGRNYRGFKPYAGGEKIGTPEYYKYGKQDYDRMESLNNGNWSFIGIYAKAEVSYDIGQGSRRLETLQSGGLWGIANDSGDHLKEVEQEELAALKEHLKAFGVNVKNFDKIEVERED